MMNRTRQLLALLLTVVMLLSILPAPVYAESTAEPTEAAVVDPTVEPTAEPTVEVTAEPTAVVTAKPTAEPTTEPTAEPTAEPTTEVTAEPTAEPTAEVTAEPTAEVTTEPTAEPTTEVTAEPTAEVTAEPTTEVTAEPSAEPTTEVTPEPTAELPIGDSLEDIVSAPVFTFDGYQTLEDFGIPSASTFSMRRSTPAGMYLNSQTIRPTSAHYGYEWLYRLGRVYPFTARFTLDSDYMPQNSVYIAIANYDCDEIGNRYSSEYDQVYINGHCVGVLTGNNNKSNTTLLKVDRAFLQPGDNQITIRVGIRINEGGTSRWGDPAGTVYADDPYNCWVLRVDDIQVLCDGGSAEGRPDVFRVNLTNAELSGSQVNCYVTTHVEDSRNRTFSLEYALYDWSTEESETYGQIIDDDFATISRGNYNHEGALTMPVSSYSGTYTAVVYLKVRENGRDTILAYDEESFEYETGFAPAFDVQNLMAVPGVLDWTSEPVPIHMSADIDLNAGLSNLVFCISDELQTPADVDANGHVTGTLLLPQNGFYTVELRYIKDGKPYKKTTTVEINNILPPLAAPVLNESGSITIAQGETASVSWNPVENATAYSIVVWDYTGLSLDATNAPVVARVDDQTTLAYSHTFPKAGTYVIGVYSCCPGSTAYSQSRTAGSIVVHVTPIAADTVFLEYSVNGGAFTKGKSVSIKDIDKLTVRICRQTQDGTTDVVPFSNSGYSCMVYGMGSTFASDAQEAMVLRYSGDTKASISLFDKRGNVITKLGITIEKPMFTFQIKREGESDYRTRLGISIIENLDVLHVRITGKYTDGTKVDFSRNDYQFASMDSFLSVKKIQQRGNTEVYAEIIGTSEGWSHFTVKRGNKIAAKLSITVISLASGYQHLLSDLADGRITATDERLLKVVEKYLLKAGLSNLDQSRIDQIIEALKTAPCPYNELYLFTLFEYSLANTNGTSNYNVKTDTLSLGLNTSNRDFLNTWFHESGHAIDGTSGLTIGKDLRTRLNKDVYNLLLADATICIQGFISTELRDLGGTITLTDSQRKSILSNLLGKDNAPHHDSKQNFQEPVPNFRSQDVLDIYNSTRSDISTILITIPYSNAEMAPDVMGGMTNNTIHGNFGHSCPFHGFGQCRTDYWFNGFGGATNKQSSEAWAEFYSAKMIGDETAQRHNWTYFHDTCEYFEELAETMLEEFKARY